MANLVLQATERKVLGKKVKKLRKEGLVPGNVYGKKIKSKAISMDAKEFAKVYKEAGETSLIDLQLGKTKNAVLVRNIQQDPIEGLVLHVDFQQVDLKEKITAEVPVVLVGESPAEKQSLGTVVQHLDTIEVEALPADLPENFEIDKSQLAEVDQAVLVKDLKVDTKKVEIKANPEEIVVKVEPPKKEEEVAPAPAATEETPAEGAPAEGEAPKEGATGKPEENKKE